MVLKYWLLVISLLDILCNLSLNVSTWTINSHSGKGGTCVRCYQTNFGVGGFRSVSTLEPRHLEVEGEERLRHWRHSIDEEPAAAPKNLALSSYHHHTSWTRQPSTSHHSTNWPQHLQMTSCEACCCEACPLLEIDEPSSPPSGCSGPDQTFTRE